MSRLGTENASSWATTFSAASTWARRDPLQPGCPGLPQRPAPEPGRDRGARGRPVGYCDPAGILPFREAIAAHVARTRGSRRARRASWSRRGQAAHRLHLADVRGRGRRGHLSLARLPHLRVVGTVRGRGPGAAAALRRPRLRLHRPRPGRADHRADQGHHPVLAVEPDGGRAVARRTRGDRRADPDPLPTGHPHLLGTRSTSRSSSTGSSTRASRRTRGWRSGR